MIIFISMFLIIFIWGYIKLWIIEQDQQRLIEYLENKPSKLKQLDNYNGLSYTLYYNDHKFQDWSMQYYLERELGVGYRDDINFEVYAKILQLNKIYIISYYLESSEEGYSMCHYDIDLLLDQVLDNLKQLES